MPISSHFWRPFGVPETPKIPDSIKENSILVDTDVFSFIFRGDSRAEYFQPYLVRRTPAMSFMSVAELYYGAYKSGWGATRVARLESTIKNYVVLPYDYLVCQQWAQIRRQLEVKGHSMSHSDLWIAACALRYGCALATNNASHFCNVDGLIIICSGSD